MPDCTDKQVDSVLKQALVLSDEDRETFLDETCGDDASFRRYVDWLLLAGEADDSLLQPGGGMAGPLWEDLKENSRPMDELKPGEEVGVHRIVRRIGVGGMATVYLAERIDGQIEQQVALKILDARNLDESQQRFQQERQILASLDHPNIARLLDAGLTSSGRPYVAMEYIDGQSIDTYCDTERLKIDARLRLFRKVAAAVQYAHRSLIIHRDIKPSNILVTADGVPKLLDFGIAKLLETDILPHAAPMTRAALPMTPEYASPEQIRGGPMTVAADIYQLGCLLYELLCGSPPYDTAPGDIAALVEAITLHNPAAPSRRVATVANSDIGDGESSPWTLRTTTPIRLRKRLRGDLDRIVLKALHKDPDKRYTSAARLAADVECVLTGHPVSARPDTTFYLLRKFVQRHILTVAVSMTAIVAVIIGASGFTYRLAEEKKLAELEASKAREVVSFMNDLFDASNPWSEADRNITVREVLDKGLVKLSNNLDTQPAVKAELLYHIGFAYQQLGDYDTAESVFKEALVAHQHLAGGEYENYLLTLIRLSDTHRIQGRYAEAEELARQAYDTASTALGENSLLSARALIVLSNAASELGRLSEAEQLQRRAMYLSERIDGLEPEVYATTQNNLGYTLLLLARPVEAIENLKLAYTRYIEIFGEKHPNTLLVGMNTATAYSALGKFTEAKERFYEVIALGTVVLGAEHSFTVTCKHRLAVLLSTLGDHAAAAAMLREVVEDRIHTLGLEHPYTFRPQMDLAMAIAHLGEYQEAESILRTVLAAYSRTLGAAHFNTIRAHSALGTVMRLAGECEEAEYHLQKALAGKLSEPRMGLAGIVPEQMGLARVYLAIDEPERARGVFSDTMERIDELQPLDMLRGELLQVWGTTLARLGETQRAEAALLESQDILITAYGNEYHMTQQTAKSLAELHELLGSSSETERY